MNISNSIKISLVGEPSIFRTALRMLIESRGNFEIISELARVEELKNVLDKKSDLILVDLPEDQEVETSLVYLSTLAPRIPVLILACQKEVGIHRQCLRLGINGFVLKEKNSETLFKAIEKTYLGEFWFDRMIMQETIRELINERHQFSESFQSHAYNSLTEREKQILDLICCGLKNKEIACKLFIAETTVRHHLSSIFEKLSLTNRLELIVYAFDNNLVKINEPLEKNL